MFVLAWAFFCGHGKHGEAQAPLGGADALYREGYEAYSSGDLARAHSRFSRLVVLAPQVAVGHLAYGDVLLAEGQAAAALEQLQLAQKLDPKAGATRVALGKAWLALGEPGKAAAAFREGAADGVALAAEDSLDYATALAGNGHAEQAIAVLEGALGVGGTGLTSSQKAALEDAWGTLLAQGGSLDEARRHFAAAVAANPALAGAHAHLGSALLGLRQPEAAVGELRQAVALAPAQAGYAMELGRALTATGQDVEAVAVLRSAVAVADRQATDARGVRGAGQGGAAAGGGSKAEHAAGKVGGVEARARTEARTEADNMRAQTRYALALALQASGQLAEALPLFASYAADQPGNAEALTNYALALVQTGDAKHAVILYQKALERGPDNATLREDYGVAYLQQSDLDHALAQFEAGLKLEPENPHLHYDLGLAYKLKDNLAAAVPEFEHAEALDPALPDPPYTLGVIHMQQGEFAAAAGELEKAVALQPGNAAAWSVLGNVYKQNDEPAKATEALRHAIELAPDQPSNHISLAAILAQSGDQAGAAAERKQAAELSRVAVSRQRASFALKSGRALLDQGKVKEAEAQLRTAVAADPKDPAAHQALAEALARDRQPADAALERETATRLLAAGR